MDFKKHLQKQLGFLNRSCESFDAGYVDEGIRIATIVRVLLHNTGRSTSLLQHLGAPNVNLISRVSKNGALPGLLHFMGMGIVQQASRAENNKYFANLDRGATKPYPLPASEWWDQTVMILSMGKHTLSRGKIVLAAANKDGGAHVDQKLTPEYEALSRDGALGAFAFHKVPGEDPVVVPIEGAHLVCLRQMGFELLESPELLKLAS